MSAEPEVGPFRDASPTPEARLAKERRESLSRVAVLCHEAVEKERLRESRVDALGFLSVGAILLTTGASLTLAVLDPRGPWLSLLCLASSLLVSGAVALFHRSRVRQRRSAQRLRSP
ncbi:MAG: hypothetical protein AB8I08_33705 [Sandaracinaceae bacterium]